MDGAPPPPPPPPPHGESPKNASGLPPGNYDIFIIPPHSSGSGFLYLPSLRPNANSFIAGAASAFFMCWLWSLLAPTVKAFIQTVTHSGTGAGMLVVTILVGLGAWYLGHAGHLPGPQSPGGMPHAGTGSQYQPPPSGYPSGGPTPGAGPQHQSPPNGFPNGGPPPRPAGAGWGANPSGHTGGPGYGPHAGGGYSQQQQYGAPPPQPQPQYQPPPQPEPQPQYQPPPPPRTEPYGARSETDSSERPQPRPRSYSNASANWEKAKAETKKREEERKRQEDARKRKDEEEKKKAETERQARAAAEKEKWEKLRAREKEERERKSREDQARERVAKEKEKEREMKERVDKEVREKLDKEKAEREARVQAARERLAKAQLDAKAKSEAAPKTEAPKSETSAPVFGVGERTNPYSVDNRSTAPTPAALAAAAAAAANPPPRSYVSGPEKPHIYERPTAQSYVGTATDTAYRPYDKPRPKHTSGSSFYSSYSESYAPSQSTAPSTAPPSRRGPYSTSDPDKVVIKAVYSFSDGFPKPTACLISGQDGCTDGLVLRIATEGMFVDDDLKGIGLREWDVKAWTMKGVETVTKNKLHIVRATIRDATNKNYVFVIEESEQWKVAEGLKRLKGGSLVRGRFEVTTLTAGETTKLMGTIGWS